MARAGDTIDIPHTGERIVFRKTTAETDGEFLQLDFFVNPGGFAPRMHVHATVEERVTVVSGRVRIWVAGKQRVLGPGESGIFPARLPHTFSAEGEEQLHAIVDVVPAGNFETVFETVFGLYADGKSDDHGHEPLLQGVLLARLSKSYLPGPPMALQDAFCTLMAPVARLFGHKERYEKYSG